MTSWRYTCHQRWVNNRGGRTSVVTYERDVLRAFETLLIWYLHDIPCKLIGDGDCY